MHTVALLLHQPRARRREESSSGAAAGGCLGSFGCLFFILAAGAVLFFVLRGRRDKAETLGASKRPMGSGPVQGIKFACPYPKCPNCAAPSDKMTFDYDGMRKVTWKCGYCTSVAGIQELKDEELPPGARQRLGLDPAPGMGQGLQPGMQQAPGMDVGGLLTGMMIGSMMGGGSGHHHHQDDGNFGGTGGSSSADWGESSAGGSDWGSSDSGGGTSDWGSSDSGGGSDWGGGGDSGGGGSDW